MNSRRAEWIGMMTGVCVVLGGLVAVTVRTQQKVEGAIPGGATSAQVAQQEREMEAKILWQDDEIRKLRGNKNGSSEWDQLSTLSGLSQVTGPGIMLTLGDNPQLSGTKSSSPDETLTLENGMVHDTDVLRVVNELFAAHAEAIAVDKQRIGPRTAIRCVGPVVMINEVACSAPFHIQAIGDPATLQQALSMTGGVLAELQGALCVVNLEQKQVLSLPAYDGGGPFRYAHTVPSKNEDQS